MRLAASSAQRPARGSVLPISRMSPPVQGMPWTADSRMGLTSPQAAYVSMPEVGRTGRRASGTARQDCGAVTGDGGAIIGVLGQQGICYFRSQREYGAALSGHLT